MRYFVFLCFAVSQLVCVTGYARESSGVVKQSTSHGVERTVLSIDPLNDDGIYAHDTAISNSVKNVILMIGDGMGPQQVGLAVIYAKHAPNSQIKNRKLNIEKVMEAGETGVVMVGPCGKIVVDSACSTTQFATGKAVSPEVIGLDIHGNPLETILEKARNAGKSTGLVSDTTITHATPAAFAVHIADRMEEDEIAEQLVESKADIMLSGGLQYFLPMEVNRKGSNVYKAVLSLVQNESLVRSKRKDQKNILSKARENGYELIFNKKSLLPCKSRKVLGLFSRSEMPDGITCSQTTGSLDRPPTLKEMTQKAISLLSVNKEGFFLMVEGGLIDYAGHANDTGWVLHEMLKFDEAVGAVFEWIKDRKDTLLIITADHETGSFGFSYSGSFHQPVAPGREIVKEGKRKVVYNYGSYEVLDKIYNQKKTLTGILRMFDALTPAQKTDLELKRLVNENLEFKITLEQAREIIGEKSVPCYGKEHHPYLSFQSIPVIHDFTAFYPNVRVNRQAVLARKIAEQQQVVWGTGTHTSTPVFVIAFGPEAVQNRFDGLWHSTDIGKMMIESMGL